MKPTTMVRLANVCRAAVIPVAAAGIFWFETRSLAYGVAVAGCVFLVGAAMWLSSRARRERG